MILWNLTCVKCWSARILHSRHTHLCATLRWRWGEHRHWAWMALWEWMRAAFAKHFCKHWLVMAQVRTKVLISYIVMRACDAVIAASVVAYEGPCCPCTAIPKPALFCCCMAGCLSLVLLVRSQRPPSDLHTPSARLMVCCACVHVCLRTRTHAPAHDCACLSTFMYARACVRGCPCLCEWVCACGVTGSICVTCRYCTCQSVVRCHSRGGCGSVQTSARLPGRCWGHCQRTARCKEDSAPAKGL